MKEENINVWVILRGNLKHPDQFRLTIGISSKRTITEGSERFILRLRSTTEDRKELEEFIKTMAITLCTAFNDNNTM